MVWNAKICAMALVKQNVMKRELFILGGQIIDQKRKKGMVEKEKRED